VEALLDAPRRYGELEADIPGIAPNILAERLRRLEADGLLAATAYAERPPRFEYRLTAEGRALAGALRLLADWGAALGDVAGQEPLHHAACGSALDARWFCPTCEEVVGPGSASGTRRV
jgi:DNA-binding HxlR family transcriptional regulator